MKQNLGVSHLIKLNSSRRMKPKIVSSVRNKWAQRGRHSIEKLSVMTYWMLSGTEERGRTIIVHRDSYTKLSCSLLPSRSCDGIKYTDFLQTSKFLSKCCVRCVRITVLEVPEETVRHWTLNFWFSINVEREKMTKAISKKDFVVYQKYMILQFHSWVKQSALDRA